MIVLEVFLYLPTVLDCSTQSCCSSSSIIFVGAGTYFPFGSGVKVGGGGVRVQPFFLFGTLRINGVSERMGLLVELLVGLLLWNAAIQNSNLQAQTTKQMVGA